MSRLGFAIAVVITLAAAVSLAAAEEEETVVLRAAGVVDVTSGTIERPGLLVVAGDPLADVAVLESVRFVMLGGEIVIEPSR